MNYFLMIAPIDFTGYKRIAAQQFFDSYAFFSLLQDKQKSISSSTGKEFPTTLLFCGIVSVRIAWSRNPLITHRSH